MQTAHHILLIEDQEADVLLIKTILAAHGLNHIYVAQHGEEALDYLYRRGAYQGRMPMEPSLIFLDLKLPNPAGGRSELGVQALACPDPGNVSGAR